MSEPQSAASTPNPPTTTADSCRSTLSSEDEEIDVQKQLVDLDDNNMVKELHDLTKNFSQIIYEGATRILHARLERARARIEDLNNL